jgi:hypothetical protein
MATRAKKKAVPKRKTPKRKAPKRKAPKRKAPKRTAARQKIREVFQVGGTHAFESFASALVVAASSGEPVHVVRGVVRAVAAPLSDDVAFDDRVAIEGGEAVETFSLDALYEAWLKAVALLSSDVARVEQTVRDGGAETFARKLQAWQGMTNTFATRALLEVRAARALGDAPPLDDLVRRVDAGDTSACALLEAAAFRARDLMTWRWSRAVREGSVVAPLYRARMQFPMPAAV